MKQQGYRAGCGLYFLLLAGADSLPGFPIFKIFQKAKNGEKNHKKSNRQKTQKKTLPWIRNFLVKFREFRESAQTIRRNTKKNCQDKGEGIQ